MIQPLAHKGLQRAARDVDTTRRIPNRNRLRHRHTRATQTNTRFLPGQSSLKRPAGTPLVRTHSLLLVICVSAAYLRSLSGFRVRFFTRTPDAIPPRASFGQSDRGTSFYGFWRERAKCDKYKERVHSEKTIHCERPNPGRVTPWDNIPVHPPKRQHERHTRQNTALVGAFVPNGESQTNFPQKFAWCFSWSYFDTKNIDQTFIRRQTRSCDLRRHAGRVTPWDNIPVRQPKRHHERHSIQNKALVGQVELAHKNKHFLFTIISRGADSAPVDLIFE